MLERIWHEVQEIRQELARLLGHFHKPDRVEFALPLYFDLNGDLIMANFQLAVDQIVTIPLLFSNAAGPVAAPPTGGSVSTSNATLATAAVNAIDTAVIVTPVALGVGVTITYTNSTTTPPISCTLALDVVADTVPTAVVFDIAHATTAPLPAPAA